MFENVVGAQRDRTGAAAKPAWEDEAPAVNQTSKALSSGTRILKYIQFPFAKGADGSQEVLCRRMELSTAPKENRPVLPC